MSAGGSSAAAPSAVVGYGGAGDVARVADTGPAAGSTGNWLTRNAGSLGLITSGVSAIGSIVGGQRQATADRYNADLASTEATIARQQSVADATQIQQNARRQIGFAINAAGASGVDPNVGTPVNVVSDLAGQGELSRQLALYRGSLRGISLDSKAAMLRYNAGQAADAGVLTAGTTFLTGYGKYLQTKAPKTSLTADGG